VVSPAPYGVPTPSGSGELPSGYQIVGRPKRGGMASVYKAYQTALGRHVALKMLAPALSGDPSFVQRFHDEARQTASLEHPNIVTIYDIGQAGSRLFIAMRYIDGLSLAELLAREGRQPANRAVHIVAQVAEALDYAHSRGVIHRDVKPGNIMIEPGDRVTLTDFGIAKTVGGAQLTQVGAIVGTPEYLAPEQALGQPTDHRADLYALGIVLFELLTGRTPFRAETPLATLHAQIYTPPPFPTDLNQQIPSTVAAVVMQSLAKEPAQRFQSGRDFVLALRRALAGRT
jgi:serine/threonine-protein kinase